MLRMAPVNRTRTEVVELPEIYEENNFSSEENSPPEPRHFLGEGRFLGGSRIIFPSRPLSNEWEGRIHNRIQDYLVPGELQDLFERLNSAPLSDDIRREFETWRSEFDRILPRQNEERSLSLAILAFRIIRPALLNDSSSEHQSELLKILQVCEIIIGQLLPAGESVKDFIQNTEENLITLELDFELGLRADQVGEEEEGILSSVGQTIHTHLEQGLSDVANNLVSHQNSTKEKIEQAKKEVQDVETQKEQLKLKLKDHAEKIAKLGSEDNNAKEFNEILEKGKSILKDLE